MEKIEQIKKLLLKDIESEERDLYSRVINQWVNVPQIAFELNIKNEQTIYDFIKIFNKWFEKRIAEEKRLKQYLESERQRSYFNEKEETKILEQIQALQEEQKLFKLFL